MNPRTLGSPIVEVRSSIPVWLRIALASLFFLLAPVLKAATVYVDVDATGADNGTSWTDAYPNLQDALAAWSVGDEIWVAEGRYFPDIGALHIPGDQTSSFELIDDMKLYGGFDGTEGALGDRNPSAHLTVLSGDIDQNDGTDPDGVTVSHLTIAGNNSYNVVIFHDDNNTAVLDGFAVTAGDAVDAATWPLGGGILMSSPTLPNSDVTIRNTLVQGNRAFLAGGGLYNLNTPMTLADSKFLANAANDGDDRNGSSAEGGGAYVTNNSGSVRQELQRVEFDGNFAEEGGDCSATSIIRLGRD